MTDGTTPESLGEFQTTFAECVEETWRNLANARIIALQACGKLDPIGELPEFARGAIDELAKSRVEALSESLEQLLTLVYNAEFVYPIHNAAVE